MSVVSKIALMKSFLFSLIDSKYFLTTLGDTDSFKRV